MFRDTQEELKRLESALLEDSPDRAAHTGSYKAYNADNTDEDPETYSRALLQPAKSDRGLILLAVLLTLGIAAVAVYWLIRFRGVL